MHSEFLSLPVSQSPAINYQLSIINYPTDVTNSNPKGIINTNSGLANESVSTLATQDYY